MDKVKHECWGCGQTAMLGRGDFAPECIIYDSIHTFAVDDPWKYSEERVRIQTKNRM